MYSTWYPPCVHLGKRRFPRPNGQLFFKNIKSISLQQLLWMNVMLDLICMGIDVNNGT